MRLGVFGVFLAPFGALGLMCDPPIDASGQQGRVSHGEQRLVDQRELAGRRQFGRGDHRHQSARHRLDHAHRFDVGNRTMHEQIARTQQIGHIGVLVESDIGLARQQTPGAELEILLERPSTGDHQLNIAGVAGHRHRLDQRNLIFLAGQSAGSDDTERHGSRGIRIGRLLRRIHR